MKKLLTLIALVVSISAMAQVSVRIPLNNSYCEYLPSVTVTGTSTATVYNIDAAQNSVATQDARVLLTKYGGTFTDVTVSLYGTKFDDTYDVISSTTWNAGTTTAVVTVSNVSANRYRHYKLDVKVNGIAPVLKLSGFKFKLYY